MSSEPEGLRSRIRRIRRAGGPPDAGAPARPGAAPTAPSGTDSVVDLRARVAHLEQMVQGLQDSVYRESQRQERRIADLEARTEPAALAAALSKHSRERGL
jgi:hypothetical protein